MPVTTRSQKRQLQEAQDTGQPSSAKEAKISKPEDQKVRSSVVADSEDIQQKKCQKGEEKPDGKNILKRLPCEMICHIFRYLPDKDLFNQMLNDRFFEKSAGYVLQRRKINLSSLYISYTMYPSSDLFVKTSKTMVYLASENLSVENAADVCEGYEEQNGNNLTRAIHLLISYYNCSEAVVNDDGDHSSEIPLTLEAFFGSAPSEPGEKIKIRCLYMTSHMAPLLGWFHPKQLYVRGSPNWLIETSQKELKELIAGIDEILFTNRCEGSVDKVMEACEANEISICGSDSYWSDESIVSVVKANIDANNNGVTRTISMYLSDRSKTQWKGLFAPFTNSYEETGSGDDEEYNIEMPNCTFEYYDGEATLVLR